VGKRSCAGHLFLTLGCRSFLSLALLSRSLSLSQKCSLHAFLLLNKFNGAWEHAAGPQFYLCFDSLRRTELSVRFTSRAEQCIEIAALGLDKLCKGEPNATQCAGTCQASPISRWLVKLNKTSSLPTFVKRRNFFEIRRDVFAIKRCSATGRREERTISIPLCLPCRLHACRRCPCWLLQLVRPSVFVCRLRRVCLSKRLRKRAPHKHTSKNSETQSVSSSSTACRAEATLP
jgi:hypothetical protein